MNTTASEQIHTSGELRIRREILELLWRRGLSGDALLKEHTDLVDAHVSKNFLQCPETAAGMALIALGGYGRQELFPYSDIDLLLLYEPKKEKDLDAVTQAVFYPLWDAGLEVGHSVRTIKACLADAEEDFFLQVALIDARLLAGDQQLFDHLKRSYTDTFVEGRRQEFLEKMLFHLEDRHKRFGQHAYLLEPQIKEGRGGLRDIQALVWTAKMVFSLPDIESIREAGIFNDVEHKQYEKARNHLIKIRNRLHYLSSRKNDQLFLEHQEEIAKNLGYKNTADMLDVEHFMRDVFRHMQTIAATTDLFFEHVDEVLGGSKFSHGKEAEEHVFEQSVIARKGRITLTDLKLLKKKPELLMRIFMHAAKTGLPIHHRTRKAIQHSTELIDDAFRQSKQIAKLFLDILTTAKEPFEILEAMMECGVLSAYIPEFNHLDALAQHDVYHVYTVDRHLITTVGELHKLKEAHDKVFEQVPNKAILYLATFLHDIGKGTKHDHSKEGARLAKTIGARLQLSSEDIETLVFLIRNHLFLPDTALRRDLEDQNLISQCADRIKTPERLAMLYLLAMADAKATGPNVWNDWKDALLLELYLKTGLLLDGSRNHQEELAKGMAWIKEKVQSLLPTTFSFPIEQLPEDYLLGFAPEEVADHILKSRTLAKSDIIVSHQEHENSWNVLIITKDRPRLLNRICGVIAIHKLKVLSAQIFTWPDGTVVDSLDVCPFHPKSYEDQDWGAFSRDMQKAIQFRLSFEYRLAQDENAVYSSTKKRGRLRPPEVNIDNATSETFSVVEVYSQDRPGLLYDITRTLADFHIIIHRAKISTDRDHAVDVFYTLDEFGTKINNEEFQEEVRLALLHCAGAINKNSVQVY